MVSFRLKRGDTWTLECVRTDADGAAVDLTGMTIASEIVANGVRKTLVPTVTDAAAGEFTLSLAPGETETLQPVLFRGDVEFIASGAVTSSETFAIEVEEDFTNAA